MKLVLVAGLNPRVSHVGPKVLLAAGKYKLYVENYKDCELVLHIGPYGRDVPIKHGIEFKVHKGEDVTLGIKSGTEDYINVFAELINGSVSNTNAL